MKLLKFSAKNVHDYLDFDITFNQDLNFIAGLNGAGKTTALNLIASLLTPSFEALAKIRFSEVKLTVSTSDTYSFDIIANQNGEMLEVSTSAYPDETPIRISLLEIRSSRERVSIAKFRESPSFRLIYNLPSPMYLSLDRRFIESVAPHDSSPFNHFMEDRGRTADVDSGLKEALELIAKKSAEIKDKQTSEDRKLRDKIILDSFHVGDDEFSIISLPKAKTSAELRTKQKTIKSTLLSLDFKTDEFEAMYDRFFENLTSLSKDVFEVFTRASVENTKASAAPKKKGTPSPSQSGKTEPVTLESSKLLAKWFANSHQMARIDRLLKMIDDYEKAKTEINIPLAKLQSLVNSFFEQTSKRIEVTNRGEVTIWISEVERSLTVLSSGERQILIMLTHLCLNKLLPQSGIFIVDEPELSLHISWQDMFVEAVQAAGPDLQVILATHSPAIIGGRNHRYVPLNGGI